MGDFFANLSLGFGVALTPINLGLAFLGCLVGTLIGVLPGVGPIATIGSFFAGTVATLVIAALGAPLTGLALIFGPTEYFSLMVMGLVFAVVLARGSILKAIAMILVGVLLSTVGTDLETGEERMTFGLPFLADGIDFAVLAMGIFGIAEVMRNLDHTEHRDVMRQAIGRLLPSKERS